MQEPQARSLVRELDTTVIGEEFPAVTKTKVQKEKTLRERTKPRGQISSRSPKKIPWKTKA